MINSIREILNTSKDFVISRIKSPLLSSFIFAWLVFNWKIVIIFFLSDKNIEEKITKIDELSNVFIGFFLPVSVAIFYAVIYPIINYLIFLLHHKFEKDVEIRKVNNAIEVLKIRIEKVKLEHQLEKNKFNHNRILEEQKLNNEYQLKEQEMELEDKRIKLERKLQES